MHVFLADMLLLVSGSIVGRRYLAYKTECERMEGGGIRARILSCWN